MNIPHSVRLPNERKPLVEKAYKNRYTTNNGNHGELGDHDDLQEAKADVDRKAKEFKDSPNGYKFYVTEAKSGKPVYESHPEEKKS